MSLTRLHYETSLMIKELKEPKKSLECSFFIRLFKKKEKYKKEIISVYLITINNEGHETYKENIVIDKQIFNGILQKHGFSN